MNPVKILIVEDDVSSEILIRRILTDRGFSIAGVAATGEEAVSMALGNSPDIILMDIGIKGELDGVETAELIYQSVQIPIIYLTGHSDQETIERAKKTAPSAFVLKPFSGQDLAVSIEMALYKNELEQKLKESEYRLSTILATISSGVLSIDLHGVIQYMNPSAEIFARTIFERAEGKKIADLIELRDCQTNRLIEVPRFFLTGDKDMPTTQRPIRLKSLSGETFIVNMAMTVIRDPNGESHGFVLVLSDITEQYEAENRINLMAAALESIEDLVLITNARREKNELKIIYVNEGFEHATGWNKSEAIGQNLKILEASESRVPLDGIVQECLRKGSRYQMEWTIGKKNGEELLTQWQASEVSDRFNNNSHIVFIIRDISNLRTLQENLRQSQKLEAMGQLAGGISHDFNNLLSVINSYSDLLSIKLDDEDPNLKYIQQIRTAGKKGADLVARLMTFSRREPPSPENFDLSILTQEMRGMLERVIHENIILTTRFGSGLRCARIDQGQFEQILVNLSVNARDAMPDGGEIIIGINNKVITQENGNGADRGLLPRGEYVCLSIADNGGGMSESVKKNIFNPFYTTKEIGKGTGLGLSTVYGIMKQCGGFIDVSSELGKGTCFHLYFQATEGKVSERIQPTEEKAVAHGTECILVVEDDATFADCISGLLRLHGYEVHTARDGEQAINDYKDRIRDINLLITDIVLPKVPGREVASRLLAGNPSLKILFMTGYDSELGAGYDFSEDFITLQKPFSLNSVLLKVRELLDEKTISLQVS